MVLSFGMFWLSQNDHSEIKQVWHVTKAYQKGMVRNFVPTVNPAIMSKSLYNVAGLIITMTGSNKPNLSPKHFVPKSGHIW